MCIVSTGHDTKNACGDPPKVIFLHHHHYILIVYYGGGGGVCVRA